MERPALSAVAFFRRSDARSLNSNAALDDSCFNADGPLVTNASGFGCANAPPGGTAVDTIANADALALGYGR